MDPIKRRVGGNCGRAFFVIFIGFGIAGIVMGFMPEQTAEERKEYMASWKPNPGVEKHPERLPMDYDKNDPKLRCERCGSTNVIRITQHERHMFRQWEWVTEYACLYCSHRRVERELFG